MITTVIFSYDRAIQLELLLESISKYDIERKLELNIIFKYSNHLFREGYEILRNKYPIANWYKENDLERHLLGPGLRLYWRNYLWWLKYENQRWKNSDFKKQLQNILEASTNDHIMFLTDDSYFIRDIMINSSAIQAIDSHPKINSYSLRFGKNIYGGKYVYKNGAISWHIDDKHSNMEWAYPFSVDGTIYNLNLINKLIQRVNFSNPNTFEGNIVCYCREKRFFTQHLSNENSCLIGTELNRVQKVNDNVNLNISNEKLNEFFLEGYKLVIEFMSTDSDRFRPLIKAVYACRSQEKLLIYESK